MEDNNVSHSRNILLNCWKWENNKKTILNTNVSNLSLINK